MEVQSISGQDSVQTFLPAVQFVGDSPLIANLKQTAGDIARRRSTVMILGETGSGKEMLVAIYPQQFIAR